MPAKAGIQYALLTLSREACVYWVPAFAGTTAEVQSAGANFPRKIQRQFFPVRKNVPLA